MQKLCVRLRGPQSLAQCVCKATCDSSPDLSTFSSFQGIAQATGDRFQQHCSCAMCFSSESEFSKLFSNCSSALWLFGKRTISIQFRVNCWWNWPLGSISSTYFRTAFMPVSPQSVRTESSLQYLFTLLGSERVKAVCRKLMKLSPGIDEKY